MESIIRAIAFLLFFTFVYGYSLYFHEKHRDDPKKLYIPMVTKDKEGFSVGMQNKSTCDINASFSISGDNSKVCLNGGNCVNASNASNTEIYKCKCINTFIGDNCEINQGVKVDVLDDFTSPTEIVRIPMDKKKGYNYFIQYNDYL